ncbi:MAG: hypothetical protein ACRENK_12150 [Gemmatimonadaceae bacterium]
MTDSNMTCEAFDAELADYIEGSLDASVLERAERHLRECVRCTSLVRDLERIRKEAGALPDLVPARDLWAGIEGRIVAPVIPLVARPEKRRRLTPAWMGVAAAALIMSTAGVTYVLTARSLDSRPAVIMDAKNTTPAPSQASESTPVDNPASRASGGVASANPNTSTEGVAVAENPGNKSAGQATGRLVSREPSSAAAHPEAVYGKEIEMLQSIVRERRAQLDPATVAVIERNLQIIDIAIEQSRAALAKDPASILLSEQLSHALDKKVDLLRTAAMLPSST